MISFYRCPLALGPQIIHDYEHRGVNNDFLIRRGDPLAVGSHSVSHLVMFPPNPFPFPWNPFDQITCSCWRCQFELPHLNVTPADPVQRPISDGEPSLGEMHA